MQCCLHTLPLITIRLTLEQCWHEGSVLTCHSYTRRQDFKENIFCSSDIVLRIGRSTSWSFVSDHWLTLMRHEHELSIMIRPVQYKLGLSCASDLRPSSINRKIPLLVRNPSTSSSTTMSNVFTCGSELRYFNLT